jgi:hypothetical protein
MTAQIIMRIRVTNYAVFGAVMISECVLCSVEKFIGLKLQL